jgi:OOP family OmpA-OmpF porin
MKYYISSMLLFVALSNGVLAQNETSPWKITVGTNAVQIDPKGSSGKDTETQISPNFSYLEVSRYLGKGFSIDLAGTMNNIDRSSGAEDLYFGIDLGTSLSANQIIDLGKFEPTLRAGAGLSGGISGFSAKSDDFYNVYAGLGLSYWFNDALALSLKSTVKFYSKELDGLIGNKDGGNRHLQHLLGLSFAFGGESDKDKDGVKDSEDACPEVAGLVGLKGCPDDDGDGIINRDDDCPLKAGLAALDGCPDADGDGIKDEDDACPDDAGLLALDGCPDADDDGISDADDMCPEEAGPVSNNGCPEIIEEEPMKEIITKPEYPISMLEDYVVHFNFEKHKKIDFQDEQLLYVVAKVMLANPEAYVSVQGHTDSVGKKAYNQTLSENRAMYVKKFLENAGVNPNRLVIKAFGESKPDATNATEEGRALNRRVEFKVIN